MPKNTKLVVGGLVGVLAVAGIVFAFVSAGRQEVSTDDPSDIVHDFYKSWLAAAQNPAVDPYGAGLAEWPLLSGELRAKILAARGVAGPDPVLCQTVVPAEIAQRLVSETETGSEFLVTARRSSSTEQAIVILLPLGGGWYVDDIRCSPGEFAPEREFSFDSEGELLKKVSAPLESGTWHIAFEQEGQPKQYVPIFFGPESRCSAAGGSSGACSPDALAEGSEARVRGEMTERGVNVARLELAR